MEEMLHGLETRIDALLAVTTPQSLLLLLALSIFLGAVHALLPGHGKTLLAAQHATADGRLVSLVSPIRDALIVAFMRVASAALVVMLAARFAPALTLSGHDNPLRFVGVAIFLALGAWLCWTAIATNVSPEKRARWPVLTMGLAPDPLTAALLTVAFTQGYELGGGMIALGMATGIALTLGLFAVGGPILRNRILDLPHNSERGRRLDRAIRLGAGLLVIGVAVFLALH